MLIEDEEGNQYTIVMYTGYTGAITYYYMTPGKYKILGLDYSGSYASIFGYGNIDEGYTVNFDESMTYPYDMVIIIYG